MRQSKGAVKGKRKERVYKILRESIYSTVIIYNTVIIYSTVLQDLEYVRESYL